ncbi:MULTISPECIES: KAP family P-loop NTPase fold protein [unclassified Acinetobacter]|uniref:KAP family P-loop NTPase fold protein n=1 Tax=unclassified Acinetobacter TaxID=196816 RepID=UPI0009925E6E|nr:MULTISPECIES: P-loop NTPase fold protein [unclassified Acinetobacter]OOV84087.1 P-loop ATPase [Acinetobacter sp. ANC 5600]QOW49081.1 P-loop ATPase [Acinetobacter sp. YH12138]
MIDNQLNWPKDNFENIETAWEGDLWDRRRLGEQLTSYVDRLNCGAVLALDARWGEGKTWFVRHWAKHLDDTQHNVIYLDAFANDYLEDPFLTIAAEISQTFKESEEIDDDEIKDFNAKTASVLISLAAVIPMIAAKAGMHWIGLGGAGEAFKEVYEEGKALYDTASEEIAAKVKEKIEKKIENHQVEKQTIHDFKKELAVLAGKLDKPLVFIIDELDRCRPDFAIRLIERVKHFFDIPKIVFVLVMNKPQLSQSVQNFYGYEAEITADYFEKFIDLTIKFPNLEPYINYENVLKEELYRIGEMEHKEALNEFFFWVLALQNYKNFNSRELKRKINQYAILKTNDFRKNLILIAFVFGVEFSKDLKIFRLVLSKLVEKFNLSFSDSKFLGNIIISKLRTEYFIDEFHIGNLYNKQVTLNEKYVSVGQQDAKELYMLETYTPFAIQKLKHSDDFIIDWKNYVESGFNLDI